MQEDSTRHWLRDDVQNPWLFNFHCVYFVGCCVWVQTVSVAHPLSRDGISEPQLSYEVNRSTQTEGLALSLQITPPGCQYQPWWRAPISAESSSVVVEVLQGAPI